jgi:predicted ester cyclase
MSADDNKALVMLFNQSMKEFWRSGETRPLRRILSPDYVQHWPGFPSDVEGYFEMLHMFRAAFPDLTKTTEELFSVGDRVVDTVTVKATHSGHFMGIAPTGNQILFSEMHIARISEGRIAERWGEWDRLTLLQQVSAIPDFHWSLPVSSR